MNLGGAEILVILILALIVFGPKRLPEIGRQVGGAMRELRRMQGTVRREIDSALDTGTKPASGPGPAARSIGTTPPAGSPRTPRPPGAPLTSGSVADPSAAEPSSPTEGAAPDRATFDDEPPDSFL